MQNISPHLPFKYVGELLNGLVVGHRINVPGIGPCTVQAYDEFGQVTVRDPNRKFLTLSTTDIHPGEWRRYD